MQAAGQGLSAGRSECPSSLGCAGSTCAWLGGQGWQGWQGQQSLAQRPLQHGLGKRWSEGGRKAGRTWAEDGRKVACRCGVVEILHTPRVVYWAGAITKQPIINTLYNRGSAQPDTTNLSPLKAAGIPVMQPQTCALSPKPQAQSLRRIFLQPSKHPTY